MVNPYEPPPKERTGKKRPSVPRVLAKVCLFLTIVACWIVFAKPSDLPPPAGPAEAAGRLIVDIGLPSFFLILAMIFFFVDRRRNRA